MTTSNNTIGFNGKEITIYYAGSLLSGYGHHKVIVELEFEGEYEKFSAITTDMKSIDKAAELEGQEKYNLLYETISNQIDELILEWAAGVE